MWVVSNMQADMIRGWESDALSSSVHTACVASSNWKKQKFISNLPFIPARSQGTC